ncbi:unnamed protein product [Arabis nemorensis]|uniref:Uncharacterized protein n=1 Tax=Arabis nemorensis TaxID=586526 RepID=A0A565B8V0_9BRAS|nr:unnamed protein product [Arabis nemorensis]
MAKDALARRRSKPNTDDLLLVAVLSFHDFRFSQRSKCCLPPITVYPNTFCSKIHGESVTVTLFAQIVALFGTLTHCVGNCRTRLLHPSEHSFIGVQSGWFLIGLAL